MAEILVVDDEHLTRNIIRRILERAGHTVIEAEDGAACLEQIRQIPPDLVIIDVFMPKMDGLEAVTAIREQWPQIRIIGITGGGVRREMMFLDAIEDCGAHRVMTKPVNANDLTQMVDDVLLQPREA